MIARICPDCGAVWWGEPAGPAWVCECGGVIVPECEVEP